MTPSRKLAHTIRGSYRNTRKHWLGYAIGFSLVMHIAAALLIINADGFRFVGENTHNFLLQEIDFVPSVKAPAPKPVAPPAMPPAMPAQIEKSPQQPDESVQEPAPKPPSDATDSAEKVDELGSSSLGLGMSRGYFSGLADGRSLREDIRGYYFEMVDKINRAWWDKARQLKEPLRQDGIFDVMIQRDGTIVSVRMIKGTGSVEADRLLAEVVRSASPLPALPPTYDQGLFRAPLRIKAPSALFR